MTTQTAEANLEPPPSPLTKKAFTFTAFQFIHALEAAFIKEKQAYKDLEKGELKTLRIINPFNKSARLEIIWQEQSAPPVELTTFNVQEIPIAQAGTAFNCLLANSLTNEGLLCIIKDTLSVDNILKKYVKYLFGFSLLTLKKILPQDSPLEHDPCELLKDILPHTKLNALFPKPAETENPPSSSDTPTPPSPDKE